jgi:hypothetical protein
MSKCQVIEKILKLLLRFLTKSQYNYLKQKSKPLLFRQQIIPMLAQQLKDENVKYRSLRQSEVFKFLATVVRIVKRNMIQPGSPALLYYALEYTAKNVQNSLDKKKKLQEPYNVCREIVKQDNYRNLFLIIYPAGKIADPLSGIQLPKNVTYSLISETRALIQQVSSTTTNTSSIVKNLLLNGIYIVHVFQRKSRQRFRSLATHYLNCRETQRPCPTFCGNTSRVHFIDKHIFPDYRNSIFEPIVFSRVGIANNPFRTSAAKVCFEAPCRNYQIEAVKSIQYGVSSDVCSSLFFSAPLPVGSGAQANRLLVNKDNVIGTIPVTINFPKSRER